MKIRKLVILGKDEKMKKGYFIHNLPNEIPMNYQFCFVRSRIGIAPDANLARNWEVTRQLERGLYQFPKLTAENDVYDHSSHMVEDTHYHIEAKWVIICGLYVDLQFLNNWVGNFTDQSPIRPIIYMTYDHWDAILKGDNAEAVAITLLNKADLCMSKYGVKAPILPKYCNKLKFWEYEGNKIYWEESGLSTVDEFEYLDEPGSPIEDPEIPIISPTVPKKWKAKYPPMFGLVGGEVIYEAVEE